MSATIPPQRPGVPAFFRTQAPAQTPTTTPAPGMEALAEEGPLHFVARALRAQLETVFPPGRFDFQYLDGKLGKTQWQRLTRRPPAVCVGWAGVTPQRQSQRVFEGVSHWFVGLLTKNANSPDARLLGDPMGPGVLTMVRAATIALQGMVIDPVETPWAASGAVQITGVHALYSDEFVDEYTTLAGIELDVAYEEALPAAWQTVNSLDALSVAWSFTAAGATGTAGPILEILQP